MPKTTPAARNDATFKAGRRAPAVKPGRKVRPYPELSQLSAREQRLATVIAEIYSSTSHASKEPAAVL